tara:strand:+ start:603 stop:1028 length:426 start_codon:yes stop_codon:yes gene_type:complete
MTIPGGSLYQLLPGFIDGDGDGYGTGAPIQVCSGNSLPASYSSNNDDCYDQNAGAYPGGGAQTTHRGDGSFDYNCNGIEEKKYTIQVVYDPVTKKCPRSGLVSGIPDCGQTGIVGYDCMVSRPTNVCWCQSAPSYPVQACG